MCKAMLRATATQYERVTVLPLRHIEAQSLQGVAPCLSLPLERVVPCHLQCPRVRGPSMQCCEEGCCNGGVAPVVLGEQHRVGDGTVRSMAGHHGEN